MSLFNRLLSRGFVSALAVALAVPRVIAEILEPDALQVPITVRAIYSASSGYNSNNEWVVSSFSMDPYNWVEEEMESGTRLFSRTDAMVPVYANAMLYPTLWNGGSVELHFSAPPGHRIFVNGVPRTSITIEGDGGHQIAVRAQADRVGGFGESSSLRPVDGSKAILALGLGRLSSGQTAGVITFPGGDVIPLYYEAPSPEVDVVRATTSPFKPLQILVPSGLVTIEYSSSPIATLSFFPRAQVSAKTSSGYPTTGSPLYVYASQGSSVLKTATQGGASLQLQTVLTNLPTSTYGYQVTDWLVPSSSTSPVTTIWNTSGGSKTRSVGSLVEATTYQTQAWGSSEVVSQVFFETPTSGSSLGITIARTYASQRLISESTTANPSSTPTSWTKYEYYDGTIEDLDRYGEIYRTYRPFMNSPANVGSATATSGEVTTHDHVFIAEEGRRFPTSITTRVNGTVTAKTELLYDVENYTDTTRNADYSGEPMTVRLGKVTRRDYHTPSSSTGYMETVTKTFRQMTDATHQFFPNLPHSEKRPDGTMTVHVYYRGTFSPSTRTFTASKGGADTMRMTFQGTAAVSSESAALTSYAVGDQSPVTEADFRIVPGRSTAEALVRSNDNTTLCTMSYICTGTTASPVWQLVQRDVNTYVNGIFLESTTRDSGNASVTWPIVTNTWTKGRLDATVDENGTRTEFTYDDCNRVLTKTRTGASGLSTAVAAMTTTFEYDEYGNVKKETVSGAGTSETFVTSRAYDIMKRVKTLVQPGYLTTGTTTASAATTSTVYDDPNRTTTVTAPSGATTIELKYLDGRPASRTGTGVVAEYYTYGVESDGRLWTRTDYGSSSSSRWKKSWVDTLKRPVEDRRPGFDGGSDASETRSYDNTAGHSSTGHAYRATKPGPSGALVTRIDQDFLGTDFRTGLDVGDNGLVLSSADRIKETAVTFESVDSAWWATSTEYSYPYTSTTAPSGSSAATPVIASRTRKRLTGLTATLRSETRTIDADGNETRVTVSVDATNKIVTTTTTRPGMATDQVEKSLNGVAVEMTGHDSLAHKKRYDALGRLIGEIEARTGSETYPSVKRTYHANTPWVATVQQIAGSSTYNTISTTHYDAAGRKLYELNADSKRTSFAYNQRNQLIKQWGAATYPVAYAYNAYGEKIAMRTFRSPSQDFTTSSWPLSDDGSDTNNPDPTSWSVGDITCWVYDPGTGLLAEKQFPKLLTTDPLKTTRYTYNPAGQLATREWARTVASGANAGQRVKATYGYDATTGEQTSIAYNDGTPGVTYTYTRLGQVDTIRDATSSSSTDLRDFGYDPSYPHRLDAEVMTSFYGSRAVTRLYETSGVIGRVRGFKLGASVNSNSELEQTYGYASNGRFETLISGYTSNASTRTFRYGYLANSALLESLCIDQSGGPGGHPFTITRHYEDNRDVLDSIEAKWGSSPGNTRTKFAYHSNNLGQRDSVEQSGDVFTGYGGSNNLIHQTFGYNDRGEVTSAPTKLGAVGGSGSALTNRQHEFNYDLIGNRNWAGVTGNTADRKTYTPNALNQISTRQNSAAPFSGAQSFVYDDDGNVTDDGQWLYTWDAENRLIAMETKSTVIGAGIPAADARRLEFKYDHQHRRVEKTVFSGWNGSAFATTSSVTRFLYDGWNLIGEYSVSSGTLSRIRSYTWGLDITGGVGGAGGVGGLLQIADHASGKTFLPCYDGNGNVVGLLNGSSGAIAATYEYSPFGEFLRCTSDDPVVADQPFRFSTKFYDGETGLYSFGRRFMSPSQGRFLGRDPKFEIADKYARKPEGPDALHLHLFTGNNPINRWDYLGMYTNITRNGIPDPLPDDNGYSGVNTPWDINPVIYQPGPIWATPPGRPRGGGGSAPVLTPVTANILAGRTQEAVDKANALLDQLRTMKDANGNLTKAGQILQQLDQTGALIEINARRGIESFTWPDPISRSGDTFAGPTGRAGPGGVGSRIDIDPYAPDALVALAHELVHAADNMNGTRLQGNQNEFEPIRVENQLRSMLGMPVIEEYKMRLDPVTNQPIPGTGVLVPNARKYIVLPRSSGGDD